MNTAPEGPLVSVIIPAYNAAGTLEVCLKAVRRSSRQPFETIVVSDGSTDATEAIAARYGVRAIRNDAQSGASYARNVGVTAARGDVFFFVDADCVLAPDAIERGLAALADGWQVVFGSYSAETSAPGFLARFKNYQHHYTHHWAQEVQTSFWSGCGVVTRRAFEAVGGFDVSLRACEDIEFGFALTRAGFPVRLLREMQVEHLKRYNLRGLVKSDLFQRAVPWTRLIRSGRSEMGKLNTGRAGVASVAATGLFWLTLAASPFAPAFLLPLALAALAAMAAANAGLLGFIARSAGWLYALPSVTALLLHFTICGAGFVLAHLHPPYPRERTPAPQYAYSEQRGAAATVAAAKGS
jgi:hypothetical protein